MKQILIVGLFIAAGLVLAKAYHKPTTLEDLRSKLKSRIIDGTPADNGQFPWQAFIVLTTSSGGRVACGGSMISALWIMTAGHCAQGTGATIYLGNVNYTSSPVVVQATILHVHPDFNSTTYNNDIGLIAVNTPIFDSDNVRAIGFNRDESLTYDGSTATVSGFGITSADATEVSTLNYVDVRVISNTECAGFYGDAVVVSSTLCAVGDASANQGPCNGDSGGPLVLTVNGGSTQIGIVSFGSSQGCGATTPNGYVRTSHFAQWIRNIVGI